MGWDENNFNRADGLNISIHPPRVGWDFLPHEYFRIVDISIHPPRVGWDETEITTGTIAK